MTDFRSAPKQFGDENRVNSGKPKVLSSNYGNPEPSSNGQRY